MKVDVCGIDIGKTVFHLVGLSKEGHIVTKKRFSRKQLITFTVNLPNCLMGIEACPGAHFLARILLKLSRCTQFPNHVLEGDYAAPKSRNSPCFLYLNPRIRTAARKWDRFWHSNPGQTSAQTSSGV
jgi:hypothetical protein